MHLIHKVQELCIYTLGVCNKSLLSIVCGRNLLLLLLLSISLSCSFQFLFVSLFFAFDFLNDWQCFLFNFF